jgi:predicted Zn-dependent protease
MLRMLMTVALAITGTSCAKSILTQYECHHPDHLFRAWLERFEESRARGCFSSSPGSPMCTGLLREIEHLSAICPGHPPTLLAGAIVAYEARQLVKAQHFLDQIFEHPVIHPDAATLRARIAIEEGNLPFARRLVEEQIQLTPDHAGLREVHGAALYLSGRLDEARRELQAALAFGAPEWRVAYHLGLVEESAGNIPAAIVQYTAALSRNPGWRAAQSRLNALRQGSVVP